MTPTREEALFAAALERPAAERAAFLDGACLGDSALRARVESLLAAHDSAANPLATRVDTDPAIQLPFTEAPDEAVGQTLGRYRLLEKLGEGGCGVVYVAEQTEPVRRRVALKVIKLGMDTKAVIARFEAERQALAMMDHPNIARILDAGMTGSDTRDSALECGSPLPPSDTPDIPKAPGGWRTPKPGGASEAVRAGRPYFVMELVRGIRITDYCDQNHLPLRDRLELFIKVCQAIQHAHQKGIIHRDIKPSNILVTLHDGVPVPKVIDFGIAKATEGRLTDATVYTQLHQFIGTPAYMSPEQAEMSGLDIDTRSDIYSLGVLLYELLTGVTPFDGKELVASGLDGMRKTIREKEPVRPSTRLTQIQAKVSPAIPHSSSAIRHSPLHSDLDWIAMKCLEKDRTRRYETANGLAADLKRHLNNEPVAARPPSTSYRMQKAFRRNRLAFVAGGAVAAALVLGLLTSAWQAVRAIRARNAAVLAERRESAQRQLAELAQQKAATNAAGATAALYESLLRQARATRIARRVGYRDEVVELLREAHKLQTPTKDLATLRHEAVSAMGDFVGFRPRSIARLEAQSSDWGMTLNSDGRLLAFNDEEMVRLVELPSGRELGRWLTAPGNRFHTLDFNSAGNRLFSLRSARSSDGVLESRLFEFALGPDGRWLQKSARAIAGGFAGLRLGETMAVAVADQFPKRTIRLVNWDSGEVLHEFQRTEGSWVDLCIAASNDGQRLVLVQDSEPSVEIWDLPTHRLIHRFTSRTGPDSKYKFSNDDKLLLALGQNGTEVMDVQSRQVVDRWSGYADVWRSGSFLPGTTLAVVPRPQQNRFLVRNFARNETVAILEGARPVSDAAFAPGGEFIVARFLDEILLYPFVDARESLTLNGHPASVTGLEFSPDGRHLASVAKDRTVRLWEADTGRLAWQGDQSLPGLGQTVRFSPDGRLLATAYYDAHPVDFWNARSGRHVRRVVSSQSNGSTWSLGFLPKQDGGWSLFQAGQFASDGLHAWRAKSSQTVIDHEPDAVRWLEARHRNAKALVASPASRKIAFTEESPAIGFQGWIEDPSGAPAAVCVGPASWSPQSLSFTPDGQSLVKLNPAAEISVHEVATGACLRRFPISGVSHDSRMMILSPTGRWLAVSSPSNRGVDIHDFTTGEHLYTLPEREGTVYWLAWHPTAPRLAVARDNGDITLWDLAKIDEQLERLGLGPSSSRTARMSPAEATEKNERTSR